MIDARASIVTAAGRFSRCRRSGLLGLLASAILPRPALAAPASSAVSDYPDRAVTLVHGYPGGAMDVAIRYLAQQLSERWGQAVLTLPRTGASEIIAASVTARAAPDGYTLFIGSEANFAVNQYLHRKMPFDPEQDLLPVSELFQLPFTLAVPADSPARDMREFVALARRSTPRLHYASTGVGSPSHLLMEAMCRALGIRLDHVPYANAPVVMADLAAGRVQALLVGPYTAAPLFREGRIRVLAVGGRQRQQSLPGVPTFAQAGFPDVEMETFVGIAAPRGTPLAVVHKIEDSLRDILLSAGFASQITGPLGYRPVASSTDDFRQSLVERRARTRQRIKDLGIPMD